MCGIAGFISSYDKEDIYDSVGKMLDTIIHRGPDGYGIREFGKRVCLGHRRLAILDLSDDGLQPMQYAERYWVTFNGEIYNYIELREELQDKGLSFTTQTDTEVLIAAYSVWGEKCVEHFNGMWAFAIYDTVNKTLFCSRDRYGVKPFYYELTDERFVFASEIKEILAVKQDRPRANRDNLIAFLTNGTLDANDNTMFDGIKQLVGGHNLVFDCSEHKIRIYKWYDLSKIDLNNNNKEENYKRFADEFIRAVRLRLRADVPVGSCLSGGLDSSAIVCTVHEILKNQGKEEIQYTVSSCFEDKAYDEQEYIDAVVNETGVKSYRVFPDMQDVFAELDNIIWHMDEPFASTSIFAQWNVFREARKRGLTVMLDGQGSDEQLAGYTPFYKVLFLDLLKKGRFVKLGKEISAYKKMRSDSESSATWELLASTVLTLLFPDTFRYKMNKLFRKHNSGMPFPDKYYDIATSRSGWEGYDKRDPQKYIYTSLNYGLRALLHYEDRDSMAFSIESRVPFLDRDLTEFVYSVPLNHKIEDGKTKNILREGLKSLLPQKIYNRYSKLGFVTPEDKWLRENEEFFYMELERSCDILKEIVDKDRVMEWYRKNIDKTRRGDSTCFTIICAAHWVRVFNVILCNEG